MKRGDYPSVDLAQKIEWLIRNMWPADRPNPRNNVEAAAAISEATGDTISSTTVWKLRTGRQDNPQFKTLIALAAFFGVPIGYFGFASEVASVADDLVIQAVRREVERGTIRRDVLQALLELDEATRRVVDCMILSAASLKGSHADPAEGAHV